jgi:DNA polymerase I-like protein with 3'-5' exonuclease and polymerase domains
MRHNLIVNVPGGDAFFGKRMRQIFIAAPGKVIVGADSKGNQMRQLAARMQDEEFTNAVLHGNSDDGTDLHSVNQRRAGLPTRGMAKNFFYGLIFGAQATKVGALIGGTREQGAKFIKDYMAEMPGLKRLIDEETKKWKATAQRIYNPRFGRYEYKNGYVTGLDGRPILVENEHTILVYILQSDESIQMAAAYVWLMVQLEKKGYVYGRDFGVLIWMHDEFQIECRPENAEDIAATACQSIKWAGEFYKINCPHDGDAKIGDNWYETH